MKYMFALIGEEGGSQGASPEDMKAELARWGAFTQETVDAGAFVAGDGLQESSTATTVRIQESGDRTVTDGPFAETKEQLGGYYVLDCKDLDEALEWAQKIPLRRGAVEVRPVMDYDAAGSETPAQEGAARS